MKVNLDRELDTLDRVFHAEADFQHALAWQLHQRHDHPTIRLERRMEPQAPPEHLSEFYLDIFIETDSECVPIEVKYKTDIFTGEADDETVKLRSHGAHPPSRFDVVADIERVEALTQTPSIDRGYVVVLTNDSAYWKEPTQDVIDADFRLHDTLRGTLSWADRASQNTKTQKRDREIELRNQYDLEWRDYTYDHPDQNLCGNQDFRYLLIEVQ